MRGFSRSVALTGVGVYEVLTFPIPNHSGRDYSAIYRPEGHANPLSPDSYKPNVLSDQMVSPDTSLGFGGGDVAPFIPGSRFRVFEP